MDNGLLVADPALDELRCPPTGTVRVVLPDGYCKREPEEAWLYQRFLREVPLVEELKQALSNG